MQGDEILFPQQYDGNNIYILYIELTGQFSKFYFIFFFRIKIEAKKMTCFCDIRLGTLIRSKQKVLYDVEDPVVQGPLKSCIHAKKECPGKCWEAGRNAFKKQNVLNYMCRDYITARSLALLGFVKVSNCGKQAFHNYDEKLCCNEVDGYLC